MCWLEQWDLIPLIYDHPLQSIFDSLKRACFLLKRNSIIEEGIACGFQSNDKQKTKKELTRPPCAHSLTSALNYLHGSLPFLARRQTIFSEVPPSPKASISSKKDGAGTLTTLIGRGLGKKVAAKGKL